MVKSASGTVEEPGKNVKQKRGLNRFIHDQGWRMLFRMLDEYMLDTGGEVRVVPPQYTSRTCPACGHIAIENRPPRRRRAGQQQEPVEETVGKVGKDLPDGSVGNSVLYGGEDVKPQC